MSDKTTKLWRRAGHGFLFGFLGAPVFVIGIGLTVNFFDIATGGPTMPVVNVWALIEAITGFSVLNGLGCAVIGSAG